MIETLRTGDLIRHGRMSLGMTQAELAQYLSAQTPIFNGVDTVTISRWEAGRVYPSSKRLIAFAKTLYPKHACTTLRHMVQDRPRGHIACNFSKVNSFHRHPYLIGEDHRALAVSTTIDRLTSGSRRCVDPFYVALLDQPKIDDSDDLTLVIVDPVTNEIFGHILATTLVESANDKRRTIAITSLFAGSDRIFEFLMSQFFRYAVQINADDIYLIGSDTQQQSMAKKLGMTASRGSTPKALSAILTNRNAHIFVGDYYEVLAHPDFIGLYSSDATPYPRLEQPQASLEQEASTKNSAL